MLLALNKDEEGTIASGTMYNYAIGEATKEAIDAMQAAMMVAVIMPMMMTTMNASH